MPASPATGSASPVFDQLRTELADLAYDLERQGRRDAADVVMQIDVRVRELAGGAGAPAWESRPPSGPSASARPDRAAGRSAPAHLAN